MSENAPPRAGRAHKRIKRGIWSDNEFRLPKKPHQMTWRIGQFNGVDP